MILSMLSIWVLVDLEIIYILEIKEQVAVKFGTIGFKLIKLNFSTNKKKQWEDFKDIYKMALLLYRSLKKSKMFKSIN